jgi:hypothetical protein
MPGSPVAQLALALVVGVCLLSWWKGGPAERLGALLFFINIFAFIAIGFVAPQSAMPVVVLVDDAVTALGLLLVTLRFGSLWLGGAMLLYAAQFTLHSFYFVTERQPDTFHAVVNNAIFISVTVCLAAGTTMSVRRRMAARAAA